MPGWSFNCGCDATGKRCTAVADDCGLRQLANARKAARDARVDAIDDAMNAAIAASGGEYAQLAAQLGELVESKQRQYGDSVSKSAECLRALYPGGIEPHAYGDMMLVVRVLDKLSRIAQRGVDGQDLGGESPWKDIAGYGLLGWWKDGER